jgi:Flagellar hook-length control protein FliK
MIVSAAIAPSARGALETTEIDQTSIGQDLSLGDDGGLFAGLLEAESQFACENKYADGPIVNEAELNTSSDQILLSQLCFGLAANCLQLANERCQSISDVDNDASQVRSESVVLDCVAETLENAAYDESASVPNGKTDPRPQKISKEGIQGAAAPLELNGLDFMVDRTTVTTHRRPPIALDVGLGESEFVRYAPSWSLEKTSTVARSLRQDHPHFGQQEQVHGGGSTSLPGSAPPCVQLDANGGTTPKKGNAGESSVLSLDPVSTKSAADIDQHSQAPTVRSGDEQGLTGGNVSGPLAEAVKTSRLVTDLAVQAPQATTQTDLEQYNPMQPHRSGIVKVIDLTLVPAQLGDVRVRLRYTGEVVNVEIAASDSSAVRQLRDERIELEHGLRAQQIQVDEIVIGPLDNSFGASIRKPDPLLQSAEPRAVSQNEGQFCGPETGERPNSRGSSQDQNHRANLKDQAGRNSLKDAVVPEETGGVYI